MVDKCLIDLPVKLSSSYGQIYRHLFKNHQLDCPEHFKPWSTYEPFLTSVSPSTKGTVDYAWFSQQYNENFAPVSLLQMPDSKLLKKYDIFPNANFPSDHFSLVIDYVSN